MADIVSDPIERMSLQDLTAEFQAVAKQVREMRDDLPKRMARGEALLREMDRRCDFSMFGFVSTFAPQLVASEQPAPEANVIAFPSEAPFTELPGASLCTTAGHGAEGEVEDSAPDAAPSAAPYDGYTNGATDA